MAGQEQLHCKNLQARLVNHLHRKTRVEHMLMQAPILEISHRSVAEFLVCSCTQVPGQIVMRENLLQVRQVRLGGVLPIILDQVIPM